MGMSGIKEAGVPGEGSTVVVQPGLHDDKAIWRAWARDRRASMPVPDSAAICAALTEFLRAQDVTGVGVLAYHALPGEPDLSALAADFQLYTTRAVFRPSPRLSLHLWHTASDLSSFGARQPPRGTPEIARALIGAVLLPGLAFDRSGWRLGYGGGFYDRLLEGWPVLSVGVIPAAMLISELPHEAHDLPVQYVATELGVGRAL